MKEFYPRRQQSSGRAFIAVSLSVFTHDISKPMELGSPDLTYKMLYDETHLFWGQKVKGQGHESTGVGLCTFVSDGFF